MEKSEVLKLLHNESVDLQFVKKDGTVRDMTATLRTDKLPNLNSNNESTKKSNPEVMAVFDLYNQGWRSFRWDSLKTVNGEPFINA